MSEKDTEAAMKDPILAGLTTEQLPCVARVDGPVLVSAGAGSGKTFMITRRITYALAHPEISGVTGIDQVLAITFTTLAASEIKQRVRSSLRANGMAQQALRVDESWISTIHGMCSRMLREHAIELGLDPQFGIIDDTDRDTLLRESINEALGITVSQPHDEDDDAESPMAISRWRDLFDEYENPAHGGGDVAGLVKEIIDAASNVRDGLSAIVTGPNPKPATDIARDVWEAMLRLETEVAPLAQKKKPPKFALTVLERLHSGANGTLGDFMTKFAYLAHVDSNGADLQSTDHVTSYQELAQALDTFNPKFGIAPKDCKEANIEFRLAYDHACLECMLGLVANLRGELLDLASQVLTIFARKKDERGVLDQDDLLLRTLDALEHNESFAAQYRNRFKLVMVDEFQDTSALQIAIISKLDGFNHERLCTVGDAQQSIYRFRGADVATYRAHRREMHDDIGALCGQLTCNFRSHNDIIAFVNTVFSQPQVFGGTKGEFIELTTPADRESSLAHDRSRIEVICVTNAYKQAHSQDRHRILAQRICDEFRELHDDGSSWGDMVILLGRMASAPIFAQTLRAQGVPCIITGGSIFTQAVAVQLIGSLASCIANPLDDENLQAVLAGAMFDLSPDELLALATKPNGSKRGLWDGLRAAEMAGLAHGHGHEHAGSNDSSGDGLSDLLVSPRVQLAASTLRQAIARSGWDKPSQVLRDAVLESGWLDRLQTQGPEGMAEAANILKALRLAQKHETDAQTPRSMAAVAARMREELDGSLKEAPGALNSSAQDAVRIMTIHASKGLEFPIVALGDFYNQRMDSGSLGLETSQEKIYLTLRPSRSVSEKHAGFANMASYGMTDLADQDKKAQAAGIISADTGGIDPAYTHVAYAFYTAVRDRSYSEELAEMRRKFYVGATRPREMLILAVEGTERNSTKDNPALYGDAVIEDLRNALVGPDLDFPDDAEVDFGGHLPAHIQHIRLEKIEDVVCWNGVPIEEILAVESDEDSVEDDGYAPSMTIPEPTSISSLMPTALPAASVHTSEFSYSSIASYKNIAGGSTGVDGSLDPDETPTDPDEIAPLGDEELEEVELEEVEGNPSSQVRDAFIHRADDNDRTLNPRSAAFGSVFHSAAQWMIERVRLQSVGTRCLELPSLDRLEQLEHAWQMDPSMHERLVAGLQRWCSSDVAREALSYPTLEPEASLFVTLLGPQGEPLHLNGSVDLFCHDTNEPPEQQRAMIVDYKTGGNDRETPEGLHEKHLLQACCYAYGALTQGYAGVDLRFVRVEHVDVDHEGDSDQPHSQPQVVSYTFDASQRESLAQTIRAAYRRASLNW